MKILGNLKKNNIHFGLLNSSTFAGLLGVRKTTRPERFMSVLDVQRKACLWNFKYVQRCAYGEAWIIYTLFLDQRYMCFSLKNDKYIKALSDQQCSVNKLMKLSATILFSPWFFIVLLEIFQWFAKIDNSTASKWHQRDDKRECSVCSLRVKFNIDLSFNEMRRLYSIKFRKAYAHRQRTNKEELERVRERKFKNSRSFPRNFQFR